MDRFELAERHYFHEAERQAGLNGSVATPLAIVTALLTGTFSMLSSVTLPLWWAESALVALSCVAIFLQLVAITNLARASIRYRYGQPATVGDLLEWRESRVRDGLSRYAADEALKDMLLVEYSACASANAINNDRKAEHLENARAYTVAAVCILIVAALPYLIVKAEKEVSSPQRAAALHRP